MTIPYPNIPPAVLTIGPFSIRWYGLMYGVGYLVGVYVARRRIRSGLVEMTFAQLDSLVGYLIVGMLIGARLAYALIYEPGHYGSDPLELVRVWHGGLSFHGAVAGMSLAAVIFAVRNRIPMLSVLDTMALAGTPGLAFGRIGNFINGELYGRVTNVPWAMIFPRDPLQLPRHPSELYEALGEGVLLFLILLYLQRISSRRGWYRSGLLSGAFLIGYGAIRFCVEFTRQPDVQLGFVLGPLSAGQLLCLAMILVGVVWLLALYRNRGAVELHAALPADSPERWSDHSSPE